MLNSENISTLLSSWFTINRYEYSLSSTSVPFFPFLVKHSSPHAKVTCCSSCQVPPSASNISLPSHDKCQSPVCHHVMNLSHLNNSKDQKENICFIGNCSNIHTNMYFGAHHFSAYKTIIINYTSQTDNMLAVTPKIAALLYEKNIYKTPRSIWASQ